MRLSNGYSLLNHVNAIATVWGLHPGSVFLVQQRGILVAAVAVVAVAAAYGVIAIVEICTGSVAELPAETLWIALRSA